MATIYFHIGMPKTGTSHIQHFLYDNEEALKNQGFVYPHFGPFPGIGYARNGYFARNRYYNENRERDKQMENDIAISHFDKLGELAEEYDKIILSEEGFFNIHNSYWKRYVRETKKRNLDTKVIVYLRRQDLFAQSFWAQQVKETQTRGFKECMEDDRFLVFHFDYYSRLQEIEDFVGKGNVTVRVYENGQYEGRDKDLVSDFLYTLGIDYTDDFVMAEGVVNISLCGSYLELKRQLNRNPEIAVKQGFVQKMLTKIMKENSDTMRFDSGIYFEGDDQKIFMDKYEETNRLVAQNYLNREDGRLFYKEIKTDKENRAVYTTEELIDICGQMIVKQHEKELKKQEQIKKLKERIEKKNQEIEKKNAIIKHKQEVIDWETTPFFKKVKRKLKKIHRQNMEKLGFSQEEAAAPESGDVSN